MRRRLAAAAIAVALAAGAGAVWKLVPRDTVTPSPAGAARPGVLVYETAGFEEVDALGGARHDYPERTTITVIRSGCGVVLRWQPLDERLQEWELCAGRRLRRITERHEFFGNADRRTYVCEPGSRFDGAYRCTAGDTTETARVVSSAEDGVLLETTISGGTTGTGTRRLRLRDDGTPLRLRVTNENATPSLLGDVRYREEYELRLVDG